MNAIIILISKVFNKGTRARPISPRARTRNPLFAPGHPCATPRRPTRELISNYGPTLSRPCRLRRPRAILAGARGRPAFIRRRVPRALCAPLHAHSTMGGGGGKRPSARGLLISCGIPRPPFSAGARLLREIFKARVRLNGVGCAEFSLREAGGARPLLWQNRVAREVTITRLGLRGGGGRGIIVSRVAVFETCVCMGWTN